jgi:hypothetical protein
VEVDGPRQKIVLPTPDRVTAVDLDPDYRLWRRVDPASFPPILREVFVAPRVGLLLADADAGASALSPARSPLACSTAAPNPSMPKLARRFPEIRRCC